MDERVLARFTGLQFRGTIAAILVSLAGAGFSAHAGLVSFGGGSDRAIAPAPPPPSGYEAEDHFPGAAYFTAIEDSEAERQGATGTAPLPDMPVPAEAVPDASIHPAAAFVFRGSAGDRARALQCLTSAIYYEAGREPDDGQRAVAQVVLNRVRHPAFPNTVCGVVFQGSEKAGCQFSFACDGAMVRAPARDAWDRARRVAVAALDGTVFAPVGMATHYHTYAVKPLWNRRLVMTGAFGAHFFHRWQGWWGTPAAFNQVYRGHEPVPGPHPPTVIVAARDAVTPIVVDTVAKPEPTSASPAQPPARAQAGTRQQAYTPATLPESTILDKWKGTGQPLR